MRPRAPSKLSTGLFVLLGFAALLFLVTQITNRESRCTAKSLPSCTAQFENIGGLKAGAPVSMAGVTVGRVESISYDQKVQGSGHAAHRGRYHQIPNDSDASILTAGLLGGQYIGISPGGSEDYFKNGDRSSSCSMRSCSKI